MGEFSTSFSRHSLPSLLTPFNPPLRSLLLLSRLSLPLPLPGLLHLLSSYTMQVPRLFLLLQILSLFSTTFAAAVGDPRPLSHLDIPRTTLSQRATGLTVPVCVRLEYLKRVLHLE